ncbi:30S ribosomal protein S9 [Compostibacter hankyongensis]|uniref:Small ribosomal subunit protein uS9 n=1 Tax=Compostibacter hankyongensis TaxID=1007089 RepID=A0ABP8G5N5_9BACT
MEKQKTSVGRRKEAVARVILTKGSGEIIINGKAYKEYFPLVYLQNQVAAPLNVIEAADKFDVKANVSGGGIKGQAEAVRLGIARSLCTINADFRPPLKHAGLLRRDPRGVERKKPGQKKARKNFQFSKR